jgi:hypothetical protein
MVAFQLAYEYTMTVRTSLSGRLNFTSAEDEDHTRSSSARCSASEGSSRWWLIVCIAVVGLASPAFAQERIGPGHDRERLFLKPFAQFAAAGGDVNVRSRSIPSCG